MKLHEIPDAIERILNGSNIVIDEETGEIISDTIDTDEIDCLEMEFHEKMKWCGAHYLEEAAELKMLNDEIKRLQQMKKVKENRLNRFKDYITMCLHGQKFDCELFKVTYRTTTSTEVSDDFVDWAKSKRSKDIKNLIRVKYEPDKTAIKAYLLAGGKIPVEMAHIATNSSMNIK